MSPSEISFMAMGLVLGAAIGGAFIEAVRDRPVRRREVRLTISPNSIAPRRALTLASADLDRERDMIPGSPGDDGWLERRLAGALGADDVAPATVAPSAPPRTRVPSPPVFVPSTAVAVPMSSAAMAGQLAFGGLGHVGRTHAGGAGPAAIGDVASTGARRASAPTAVFDRSPSAGPARPRAAAGTPRPFLPTTSVGVIERRATSGRASGVETTLATRIAVVAAAEPPSTEAASHPGAADEASPEAPPSAAAACEAERHLVQERCALAQAAAEHARLVAEALRQAQRAYDTLREQVERAQAIADPREIRAAKDASHRAFRAARAAARTDDAAENAAREWLNEINRLNTAARDATRVAEGGAAELRSQLPRLERLAVEADAARITAESAQGGCQEARAALASCEEAAARDAIAAASAAAASAAPPPPVASTLDGVWPTEEEVPLRSASEVAEQGGDNALIVRILRGDRPARERLIAELAKGDPETGRQWQLRIAGLIDAIAARAIDAGYLDLPEDGFWGLFTPRERREIVGALSALGFRFDGLGGFADERVPAQRDLSLAVGYAGLDRMRIRSWPHEAELATLYAGAMVAGDEWLADEAGDLSLGRMVDALGARAGELADVWNAWGRVRPALLSTD